MFQTAELGQTVSKEDFERVSDELRTELLALQQDLRTADFPVIVVFAGVDGAGKGESVNLINEWMDPRWIVTQAYDEPSDEERERPPFWRFWRDLPPVGQIGLFQSCWYSRPILEHVHGQTGTAQFDEQMKRILAFEKMLAEDGTLILKFWMHLGKEAQKRRLKSLEKDPLQSWRVKKSDWRNWKLYDQFIATAERALQHTGTGKTRWIIVEGEDPRFRSLSVLTSLRDAIRKHLADRCQRAMAVAAQRAAQNAKRSAELVEVHDHRDAIEMAAAAEARHKGRRRKEPTATLTAEGSIRPRTVLDVLDMTQILTKADYDLALKQARADLAQLCRQAKERRISTLLVFEGVDAAGKGGSIRRLTAGLDARDYRVIPIAAPTDEERAHHYLWRFWRHLPRAGRVTVFDRSWYGRVLVERVEGFALVDEWMRAYAEINEFEEQLAQHGTVLVKFWIHITKDEQYRRFKERETIAYKKWKLTDEDWRNRANWEAYELAVNEMVERTGTRQAPWVLVEGNDKNHARIKILRTVCERLRERLALTTA
ncbi:polyphosphate kinase [Telmatospirillum siberiense]|uniref:Polyphosphate kinase n=1 Tax=Telmatospirillum siberiense TaxID=382514 RepID=A0A2N3PV94_9PROT|nr:polyphosphate kinase [Telmatospirillum siberiense]PKU24321.1 polyphosphate kinase [Telmatospirillum siberiense]